MMSRRPRSVGLDGQAFLNNISSEKSIRHLPSLIRDGEQYCLYCRKILATNIRGRVLTIGSIDSFTAIEFHGNIFPEGHRDKDAINCSNRRDDNKLYHHCQECNQKTIFPGSCLSCRALNFTEEWKTKIVKHYLSTGEWSNNSKAIPE